MIHAKETHHSANWTLSSPKVLECPPMDKTNLVIKLVIWCRIPKIGDGNLDLLLQQNDVLKINMKKTER